MVGLGFRKELAEAFLSQTTPAEFIEVAPENWMGMGGYWRKKLDEALEKYPLYTHGLSLSVGSPEGVDFDFLARVKSFLNETKAVLYSEHLSFSKCNNAHLYDLLPIPFTYEAALHVAKNISLVQEFLERPITIELVSYYAQTLTELSELEFITTVVEESGCNLLLDVNNVYVNSVNHQYNAAEFLQQLPLNRVNYIHIAGHTQIDNTLIDTHGEPIIPQVYSLLELALRLVPAETPVLLERDFNIPEINQLNTELRQLQQIVQNAQQHV